jgi:hypothetical protein
VAGVWPTCRGCGNDASARPEWYAAYVYDRRLPTFFLAASREMSRTGDSAGSRAVSPSGTWRDTQSVTAGMRVPFRRVRFSQYWWSAFDYERQSPVHEGDGVRHRPALQFAWAFGNAHEYGYSVSAERGLRTLVTVEQVPKALGACGSAGAATAQVRGYLPAGGRHAVLALRAGAATSSGDRRVASVFELGGAGPDTLSPDFGSTPLTLMRAFPEGAFSGRHLALVNLDYRIPLARPERGHGLLPLFVRTVHGSVFLDAGRVWSGGAVEAGLITSTGLELSGDLVLGYYFPLTVTSGVAWGRRSGDAREHRVAAFVRVGRAF